MKLLPTSEGDQRLQLGLTLGSVAPADEKVIRSAVPILIAGLKPGDGTTPQATSAEQIIPTLAGMGPTIVGPVLEALDKGRGPGLRLAEYRKNLLQTLERLGPRVNTDLTVERVRRYSDPAEELYPDVREAAGRAITAMKR